VLVEGERRRVVGTVSMDAIAVALPGELAAGTPVTLVGEGLLLEEHARVADTINYELACSIGIAASATRAGRRVVDA
jgi:alanine racemase